MEAPASLTVVGKYQRFDGVVEGDGDEGYHPVSHDRSHRIACPCPCLYPGLNRLPNRVANATVTVAASCDLELALNRSAEFPNEPACVSKAMGTEREAAEEGDCGNGDRDHSSVAVSGH